MEYKEEILQFLIRAFVGILFLFQGYDKIFKVKISGVVNTFLDDAEHHHLPRWMVTFIACFTSYVEFIGGALLLAGVFTQYTLLLLGLDLLLAALAFSLLQPMWDLKHVFPRLVMVAALLLMPKEWNYFSIDNLINNY